MKEFETKQVLKKLTAGVALFTMLSSYMPTMMNVVMAVTENEGVTEITDGTNTENNPSTESGDITGGGATCETEEFIEIENEAVKTRLLSEFDKDSDGKLSKLETDAIESVYLQDRGEDTITDIRDLVKLNNLKSVDIWSYGDLADISPLGQIKTLESIYLHLSGQNITDMSFLSELTNLERISIAWNSFKCTNLLDYLNPETIVSIEIDAEDINVKPSLEKLPTFTRLTDLTLKGMRTLNLNEISTMQSIETLNLSNNNITDISALENMTNLKNLTLDSNAIEDFTTIENREFEYLNISSQHIYKDLEKQDINSETIEIDLPQFLVKALNLEGYTIDWLRVAGENAYINYADEAILSEDKTKVIITPEHKFGKRQLRLRVTNTNYLNMQAGELNVNYEIISKADNTEEIVIENERLKQQLLENNDIDSDGKITAYDLENIEIFSFQNYEDENEEIDLDILRYCTNLKEISLYGNCINTQVLEGHKYLEKVAIESNKNDITWIENLPNLKELRLSWCNISNINWDNVNSQITSLSLTYEDLTDIDFITRFTNLTTLSLSDNQIEDFTILENTTIPNVNASSQNIKRDLGKKVISSEPIEVELPPVFLKMFSIEGYSVEPIETPRNEGWTISYSDEITLSEDKTKLIIRPEDRMGSRRAQLTVSNNNYMNMYGNTLIVDYTIDSNADNTTEVDIQSEVLKSKLLQDYDSDKDGKITVYDLENIIDFNFYSSNEETDIDCLKYCKSLNSVSLSGKIKNTQVLKDLKYITHVGLYNIEENLNWLERFNKLDYLHLYKCNANSINWNNVSTSLTYLSLDEVGLTNIDFITRFANLMNLNLCNNEIGDINPIKQLQNITYLQIDLVESNFETIEQLDTGITLHCNQKIDLGEVYVEKGQIKEIEVPAIIKKAIDPNSRIYFLNENGENIINFGLSGYSEVPLEISYNRSKGKIVIDATNANVESTKKTITMSSYGWETGSATANINMQLIIYQPVSEKIEINFANERVKEEYLKNYDADKDGKITNYDMLQLRKINLFYDSNDLTGLEYAKNLEVITSTLSEVEDFTKINELPLLKSISLSGRATERLSEITILNQLEKLALHQTSDKMDYDIIGGLTNLKELTINALDTSKVTDLSKLKNLTNLEKLSINAKVINADELGSLTKLEELRLQTNDTLSNIDFIANFTELERLYLYNNMISDITSLRNLEKLKYVDLVKNPINTKEQETAKTLQILRDRKATVNVIETNLTANIEFKDENFKRILIEDGYDLNKDNQISIDEIQRITYMYLNEDDGEISSLEGIEYAINLRQLYISAKVDDLTAILTLPKLENISAGNKLTKENIETIAKKTNLKSLYVYGTYLTDLETLSNLASLEYLELDSHYEVNNIVNLKGIEKLTNLKRLNLYAKVSNINLIKELQNLAELRLNNEVYSISGDKISDKEIVEFLNTVNIENVYLNVNPTAEIDLGNVLLGSEQKRDITEINEVIKLITNPENALYSPELKMQTYEDGKITLNGNEVTLNTEKLGHNYANISVYSPKFNTNFNLKWRNIIQGDASKIINIPDKNLEKALLETDDIDGDKKITDNDIINIVELVAQNKNISSLEGLQYAKNLTGINASYNNISDLTPLADLEKMKTIYVVNNLITDVTILNNVKWSQGAAVMLYENHINFDNENANYTAFKDFINAIPSVSEQDKLQHIELNMKRQYKVPVNKLDDVLNLDENLKNKLIEQKIDTNNDNKITARELKRAAITRNSYDIDLSNANITNISGLENISSTYINLSGNNISDITPITNAIIYSLNLSKNNISDISGIDKCYFLQIIDLSKNNISNIEPLTNLMSMKRDNMNYRAVSINLSKNAISDISCVKDWKNAKDINLSNNQITDISVLKDYNFRLSTNLNDEQINEQAKILTIDLSGNSIDMTNAGNKQAKEVFDNKGATLKVEGKSPEREEVVITNSASKEEIIEAINKEQNVTLDMKEEVKEISSQVFDTLADKENVELKVETPKAKWTFNSDTIKNKEITLNPTVTLSDTRFENMEEAPSEDGIFIKFEHEGLLPGKAEIELDIKDCASKYENGKTVYLYYYNSDTKKYEFISTVTSNDNKVKIKLEHCSEYFITDEKLPEPVAGALGDTDGNGKITTKDAKMVLQHIVKKITLTDEQFARADADRNGKITTKDAKMILQHIVKKIDLSKM